MGEARMLVDENKQGANVGQCCLRISYFASVSLVLVVLLSLVCQVSGQVPMGPGSMAPYSGGGGGRSRGFGYVRDPAMGFFIAGSTIRELNGVYKRVEQVPSRIDHKFQLAYRKWPWNEPDNLDGWHIALVESPANSDEAGYTAVGGGKSEWLIIDGNHRDRFGHKGETVIPGAGTSWQHLHRLTSDEKEERRIRRATGQQDAAHDGSVATASDEDELPWQVIFIGDADMVERLRYGHRHYEQNIRQAISGGTCEHRAGGCSEEECPFDMPAVLEAEEAVEQGKYAEAAALYAVELAKACGDCPKEAEFRKYPKWREGTLSVHQARCFRRARLLDKALDVLQTTLAMLPRYKDAWLEKGKLLLEIGRPDAALNCFEHLLKLDRAYPNILAWLVRARANIERATSTSNAQNLPDYLQISSGLRVSSLPSMTQPEIEQIESAMARAGIEPSNQPLPASDHYSMLGVPLEFTGEELKKAYKKVSRIAHPDKNGGSNTRFQAVAAAYETLSDADRKEAYDAASDIRRELQQDGSEGESFWDKMRRTYFPEQFGYEPFGDPYEAKRNLHERRRQEPNGQDIPAGSYQSSCQGCSLINERRLRCTHCTNGYGNRIDTSILVKECSDAEWIGNHDGKLACEPRPQQALPPQSADPEISVVHSAEHEAASAGEL